MAVPRVHRWDSVKAGIGRALWLLIQVSVLASTRRLMSYEARECIPGPWGLGSSVLDVQQVLQVLEVQEVQF